MPEPANLLRHERSPYLLQHADNPVHWRPWGAAALAEAEAANRPILLSIGYAACHWCHVMAHESFEDAETAALMNHLFVSIKVDREERPDIDHIYMSALQALGQQGGWPLTMFLTPDGTPFWGGTYFPPEPRWGRPSFRQVLQGIANAWDTQQDAIRRNTQAMSGMLAAMAETQPAAGLAPADLDRVAERLLGLVDPEQGGLRGAPKFPNPPIFRFLWQRALHSGRPQGRAALHHLLAAMSSGGIYDHLGGGYARYSTDATWLVPHFEKMLYDNAQILELLALAQADAPNPLYVERAEETVGWLLRDMGVAPDAAGRSAFAASEDADSEGEEGRFYVWTAAEIDALLGPAAPGFKAAYDASPGGNWEGRTILRRITPRGDAASEASLSAARAVLFQAREKRLRPGRDDKVLADWNGLAVAGLCRAGAVFGRPEWISHAGKAFDFLLGVMRQPDGRAAHAWRLDRTTASGLLDDQASLARAALALFEVTGDAVRRDQAIDFVRAAETCFADTDGSFFTTASDATDVPAARPRSAADSATPSGNGLMAEVYARLFHLTGEAEWRRKAEAVIAAFAGAGDGLSAMPTLLAAAGLLENAASVVIAGPPDATATSLLRAALAAPDPSVVVLRAEAGLPIAHPAYGKAEATGRPAAFLCRGGACGLPLTTPDALAAALRSAPSA